MSRIDFKPGNMLYPLPVVLVTVTDGQGHDNVLTVAWAGTICSDPPMVSISVRKERYSYEMLRQTGEFVIHLTTKELAYATDFCGVRSGRDMDKFALAGLTRVPATKVAPPILQESPVAIECVVEQVLALGSHDMFVAKVVAVTVDESLLDETGRFHLNNSNLLAYSHGQYRELGATIGKFGYSVAKDRKHS